MTQTIEQIENIISEGIQSPHVAADLRVELSAKYSRESGRLELILKDRPMKWMAIREKVKSDKAADRAWEATEQGTDEMIIRLRLKRIEKLISALSSILKVFEGQSKNQY